MNLQKNALAQAHQTSIEKIEQNLKELRAKKAEIQFIIPSLHSSQSEIMSDLDNVAVDLDQFKSQLIKKSEDYDVVKTELDELEVSLPSLQMNFDSFNAEKLEVEAEISQLTSEINRINQPIEQIASNITLLTTKYKTSRLNTANSLKNVVGLRAKFIELTQIWEARLVRIINTYKFVLANSTSPTLTGLYTRYINFLDDFLIRYRRVFASSLAVYDQRIKNIQVEIVKMDSEYAQIKSELEKIKQPLTDQLNLSTSRMHERQVEMAGLEFQVLNLQEKVFEAQQNRKLLSVRFYQITQELEELLIKENNAQTDLSVLQAERKALENQLQMLIADLNAINEEVDLLLERMAILIADPDHNLSREEKIEKAKQNLLSITKVDTGRCQGAPDHGVLVACFLADKNDIVRISYQDFLDIGVDLKGVPKESIGVFTFGINNLPVFVDAADLIDTTSYLEIVTEGYDSNYSDERMYQVYVNIDQPFNQLTKSEMFNISDINQDVSIGTFELVVDNNHHYSNAIRNDSGWYDPNGYISVPSEGKAKVTFEFELDEHLASSSEEAVLDYNLAQFVVRGDYFTISAAINGIQFGDSFHTSSELTFFDTNVLVPANILTVGTNVLELTVSKTGSDRNGIAEFDGFKLSFPKKSSAINGVLNISHANGAERTKTFKIDGFNDSAVVAYASGENSTTRYHMSSNTPMMETTKLEMNNINDSKVIVRQQFSSVELINARDYKDLSTTDAQYLIVSHPDFINTQAMNDLVALRSTEYSVAVVDVDEIYAQYNGGTFGAYAIKDYLTDMIENAGTELVLLVGDDTYDYKNKLNLGVKSYIPSLYFNFPKTDPSDSIYVDIDNDQLPEIGIGRMPVESEQEFANIVEKTIIYANHNYANTALMITNYTSGHAYSLHRAIKRRFPYDSTEGYGAGWDIDEVLINPADKVLTAELVDEARESALLSLNEGAALTVYTGHNTIDSGHVFHDQHIPLMKNAYKPTVLMSIDSYTGRYIDDSVGLYGSTKAESILVAKDVGAAAVFANASSNALGQYQMDTLKQLLDNNRLGDAHRDAFIWAANTGRAYYNLLGDPALRLQSTH